MAERDILKIDGAAFLPFYNVFDMTLQKIWNKVGGYFFLIIKKIKQMRRCYYTPIRMSII